MIASLVTKENYEEGRYFAGKQMVGMLILSATPQNVSADQTDALVYFPVNTKYNGCYAVVSVNRITATPYSQIKEKAVGIVENGKLPVEFYGTGFVKAHTFSISAILFK